jgi:hypothetical protein
MKCLLCGYDGILAEESQMRGRAELTNRFRI